MEAAKGEETIYFGCATSRRLLISDVPESHYKADLELHDRSQAFSSELLKLGLALPLSDFLLAHFP